MYRTVFAAAAFVLPSICNAQQMTRLDEQWESEGQYHVFASPWCRHVTKSLLVDRDFRNRIMWYKGSLPNGVTIRWRWPSIAARPPGCGVYGYDYIAFGNYDGGRTLAPVTPRQVRKIAELKFSYDVNIQANPANFNGLFEFMLTRAAGRSDQKAVEIGWLWHAPPETAAWAASTAEVGRFTDRYGVRWKVNASNTGVANYYITFIPENGTRPAGTIDAKNALAFLVKGGWIKDDLWFNGAAIGVEPLGSAGIVQFRRFEPAYK